MLLSLTAAGSTLILTLLSSASPIQAILTTFTCASSSTQNAALQDCIKASPNSAESSVIIQGANGINTVRCDDTNPSAFNSLYLPVAGSSACVCYFNGGDDKVNGTSVGLQFNNDNGNCDGLCPNFLNSGTIPFCTSNLGLSMTMPTAPTTTSTTSTSSTTSTTSTTPSSNNGGTGGGSNGGGSNGGGGVIPGAVTTAANGLSVTLPSASMVSTAVASVTSKSAGISLLRVEKGNQVWYGMGSLLVALFVF